MFKFYGFVNFVEAAVSDGEIAVAQNSNKSNDPCHAQQNAGYAGYAGYAETGDVYVAAENYPSVVIGLL
jgi:hypothetical protein